MRLKRLVIDVLIPHQPEIMNYAERLCNIENIEQVIIHLDEVDDRTKSVHITIEGEHLSLEDIRDGIEELGGSIHSIDEVTATAT